MMRRLSPFAGALTVVLILLTPALVLAEKPPPSPSVGKIVKIEENSFDWTCGSDTWHCIPAKGETTIKGLDKVKNGDTVEATFTHAGGLKLYVTEVKPSPN